MKIAISGSSGYIGNRLLQKAKNNGFDTIELRRNKPKSPRSQWIKYDISNNYFIEFPKDVDIFFHLAATTSTVNFDIDQEIRSASMLIESANKVGAHFVFISSQTAQPDAPTQYGKAKWRIERVVMGAKGTIIRPGQVYGGSENGLFGLLSRALRISPVIPRFIPEPKIQPIHIDDLVDAMLSTPVILKRSSAIYCLGDPNLIRLSIFLQHVSKYRLNKMRVIVPIPIHLLNIASFVPVWKFSTVTSVTRIKSLLQLPTMQTTSSIKSLGVTLRPIHIGMTPGGKNTRRSLLREGNALLTYILRSSPNVFLIKRYARAIEQIKNGTLLHLSECVLRCPSLLAAIDKIDGHKELAWRLDAAVSIAEASPIGSVRFLGINRKNNFTLAALRIAFAMTQELSWRIFSPLVNFILKLNKGGSTEFTDETR